MADVKLFFDGWAVGTFAAARWPDHYHVCLPSKRFTIFSAVITGIIQIADFVLFWRVDVVNLSDQVLEVTRVLQVLLKTVLLVALKTSVLGHCECKLADRLNIETMLRILC